MNNRVTELMAEVTAKLTIRLLEEINIDPSKICNIPAFIPMVKKLISGHWTEEQFQQNCMKINFDGRFNNDEAETTLH